MNRILFVLSMIIFATLGVFVSPLSVPSSVIAFFRAFLGTLVLLGVILLSGKKIDRNSVLANARYLFPSGIALGFNWVLLFEGYRMTGVATATLCYYRTCVRDNHVSLFIEREVGKTQDGVRLYCISRHDSRIGNFKFRQ